MLIQFYFHVEVNIPACISKIPKISVISKDLYLKLSDLKLLWKQHVWEMNMNFLVY